MPLKKSKFKQGQPVFARPIKFGRKSFLITFNKYIPNYEWYAEYLDVTGIIKNDYIDEREFD